MDRTSELTGKDPDFVKLRTSAGLFIALSKETYKIAYVRVPIHLNEVLAQDECGIYMANTIPIA